MRLHTFRPASAAQSTRDCGPPRQVEVLPRLKCTGAPPGERERERERPPPPPPLSLLGSAAQGDPGVGGVHGWQVQPVVGGGGAPSRPCRIRRHHRQERHLRPGSGWRGVRGGGGAARCLDSPCCHALSRHKTATDHHAPIALSATAQCSEASGGVSGAYVCVRVVCLGLGLRGGGGGDQMVDGVLAADAAVGAEAEGEEVLAVHQVLLPLLAESARVESVRLREPLRPAALQTIRPVAGTTNLQSHKVTMFLVGGPRHSCLRSRLFRGNAVDNATELRIVPCWRMCV